jgi:dTDP-4-dehydrorhamnose reductase
MHNVFITGGSGLLGSNLIKELTHRNIPYSAPSHSECNIQNFNNLETHILNNKPSVIIHCAAVAKFADVEKDPINALDTNVIGTANVVKACMLHNIRLVFISTSHVFDGKRGMYKTTDTVNPITKYAKMKVADEYIVSILDNSLSIRTEFCGLDFPFEFAYHDKWSSKDYIDKLAPEILDVSLSYRTGICHVAGPRRSFYELGLERNPNVKPGSIVEAQSISNVPILVDTSLDIN